MSDTDSSADHASSATTTPPDQHADTDPAPCQYVPAASAAHPVSPHTLLATKSVASPQSTGEILTEDTTSGQTVQGPADQSVPPAESQVMECDEPVSLEPDAAEENVEVCKTSVSRWSKMFVVSHL